MNARRLALSIIERSRGYVHRIYWSVVGLLSDRRTIWPNASAARAARRGTEKAGRKIFVMMHSGRLTDLYVKCFETARRHSPDARIELFTDFTEAERTILRPYGVIFHDIRTNDYARKKMTLKIELLKCLDLEYGDNIIVSDVDVIFQSDPFTVFENDFDVFFTTRHYDYHYVINGGVWGFCANERSRDFIRFFVNQMFVRSWKSQMEFGKRFGRDPYGPGWFVDQDFLCTVYENLGNLPREISGVRFYDAGYKYNFCPSYDIYGQAAVDELKSKIGNPDYVVLHLKAELKRVLDVSELGNWKMEPSSSNATKDSSGDS